MQISNETDKVLIVYSNRFEETIACNKTLTIPDALLEKGQVLYVRYYTKEHMKLDVDSGWDKSTFRKRIYYYWNLTLEYPINLVIRFNRLNYLSISEQCSVIQSLLFPKIVVRQLKCQSVDDNVISFHHSFSSSKERTLFLVLQIAKSLMLSLVTLFAFWYSLKKTIAFVDLIDGATSALEYVIGGWLLTILFVALLIPNVKFLFIGMKWKVMQ